jgi:ATP-dependent RNA helicase RhlE
MKFQDYHINHTIKKNLAAHDFKRPTDIQFKTIPHVLNGEDVLAIAQTGTGKTAAFVIPLLHLLITNPASNPGIRCVVLAPTHELAKQIHGVFEQLGEGTGIKSAVIIGGVEQDAQIQQLKEGVDVLVATPGRVFDLINQGHLHIYQAQYLVVDEADQMLDRGFYKDITDLIRYLAKKRQTLYFSATIDANIKKLAYSLVHNPIRIQISPKNMVSRNVTHHVAPIEMDDKRFFLERMVKENPDSKMLVFVRTKVRAERVRQAMERSGIQSVTIHSDKDQAARDAAMQQFLSGETKMLIATDVSARGIDIPNVEFVVNYDLPEKVENYIHRVGRTGRGMQKGVAVSFCSQEEKTLLGEIEEYLGGPIDELEIKAHEYHEIIEFSGENADNWRKLMKEADQPPPIKKQKKRK